MTAAPSGEIIRVARERRGMLQWELARAVGVSDATVSRWESGLHAPSARYARALADVLGIPADDLMGGGG